MIAPDFPLEPAPRNDFSRSTTRPTRRWASRQAMLAPMTPPPTIKMSQLTAMWRSSPFGKRLVQRDHRAARAFRQRTNETVSQLPGFAMLGNSLGVLDGSIPILRRHAAIIGDFKPLENRFGEI